MLRSLVSRFTRGGGAAGRARPTTGTTGTPGTRGAAGKRGQDEAIGRGVRSLLRKVR